MYRQYEDPHMIEKWMEDAKAALAQNPGNIDLHEEVADLEERLNFAWQDDEAECEGYEW